MYNVTFDFSLFDAFRQDQVQSILKNTGADFFFHSSKDQTFLLLIKPMTAKSCGC